MTEESDILDHVAREWQTLAILGTSLVAFAAWVRRPLKVLRELRRDVPNMEQGQTLTLNTDLQVCQTQVLDKISDLFGKRDEATDKFQKETTESLVRMHARLDADLLQRAKT